MKKFLLLSLCIFSFHFLYSNNPYDSNSIMFADNNGINTTKEKTQLNLNYQQFKHQVVNFESNNSINYGYLKKRRRRSGDDNLMLYVAGGIAVATTTLILTNDPENFTTNSAGSVNMGIAIGGTVGCALFVAKYFIDKSR